MADAFKSFVFEHRPQVPDEAMQGQIFTGEQAVTTYLADELFPDRDALWAAVLDS